MDANEFMKENLDTLMSRASGECSKGEEARSGLLLTGSPPDGLPTSAPALYRARLLRLLRLWNDRLTVCMVWPTLWAADCLLAFLDDADYRELRAKSAAACQYAWNRNAKRKGDGR